MRRHIKHRYQFNRSFIGIALCFSLMLSSCGFHLRGSIDMPRWFNHVSVIVEHAHQNLSSFLVENLLSYNLSIEPSPSSAQYWLIILQDNLQQQITSVSSSTTPRQYELTYTVHFKLMKAKGRELISPSVVSVTRQATINSDRILGSNQEEELLVNEMRREAATQIINRVSLELSRQR